MTFSYDDNGNTTGEERGGILTVYAYDRENRLRTETAPDLSRTTMLYDGDGLRRMKRTSMETVTYIWDDNDYLGEVKG